MKPTKEEIENAQKHVNKYLNERAKMLGLDREQIHGLHTGHELKEATLDASDLRTILAALESAQAEVTTLEKQVDELQTELSKWPT